VIDQQKELHSVRRGERRLGKPSPSGLNRIVEKKKLENATVNGQMEIRYLLNAATEKKTSKEQKYSSCPEAMKEHYFPKVRGVGYFRSVHCSIMP
jgi:hypothetical protein